MVSRETAMDGIISFCNIGTSTFAEECLTTRIEGLKKQPNMCVMNVSELQNVLLESGTPTIASHDNIFIVLYFLHVATMIPSHEPK